MKIKVILRHQTTNYTLEISKSDTLGILKKKIHQIVHIDPKRQILLCNDKILTEDKKVIHDLDIKQDSIIFIREEKQSLSLNPEHMKSMLEMMPHMKEEMEDNPQLRAMLNSSSFQDDMASMSGDPNLLKEQMKNYDITVSKLENMPGGFNMINSMMKDVQDPLMNAFTDGLRGNKYKEGGSINKPIQEPIPGANKGHGNLLLKYKEELALLRAMGFDNSRNNLSALIACQGNVDETIEHLKNKNG